jgi:hypothetical protein
MSVTALRDMVMLPENRPAMRLLLRSTMAMAGVPIAVYYFFFNTVLGPQGWYDMSDDLNWRVNYSGFAALTAVQVRRAHSCGMPRPSHVRADGRCGWAGGGGQFVIVWHVVAAFQQDAADAAREAEIKAELKAARAARCAARFVRACVCVSVCLRVCVCARAFLRVAHR